MACPATGDEIVSRYMSQKVVSGNPCESFSIDKQPADSSCLVGVTALGNPLLGIDSAQLSQSCSDCKTGYESQSDILDLYLPQVEILLNTTLDALAVVGIAANVDVELGSVCCPQDLD
ncbi:hypothetical protein ACOBV8_17440 [Pseudoalteromonas espejiana]